MISFNYYNLWNKNVTLTFPLLSEQVACTDEKDDYARIHPNLLPSEGHTYSLQAVGKDITFDLLEESNITKVSPITNEASYKSLNEQYPKLELKKNLHSSCLMKMVWF